jgi:TPR repeat protein
LPSSDPPTGTDNKGINEPEFAPYRYKRAARANFDSGADEPVPLFLSNTVDDIVDERHEVRSRSRIRLAVVAASVVALAVALLSVDATRDIITHAKASLTSASPAETRIAAPQAVEPQTIEADAQVEAQAAADEPMRARMAAAFQEAVKSRAMAEAPPAAPPARRLDSGELNALLKRANSLLAIGDIASARLLLERAADAEDADAALLLARTYDPDVLRSSDARSVKPDPAQARIWYRRAAELGSQHARQRLAQMQD